jgi:hypothetical protein
MITPKISFHLLKILEIFAFRHSTGEKVNTYDLIAVSQSSLGHNTLIIAADWLFATRHKDTLSEISKIFDTSEILSEHFNPQIFFNKFDISAFHIRKQNINSSVDALINYSKYTEQSNHLSYFSPFQITTEEYEAGFILQSKILPNFVFGKPLWISVLNNPTRELLTPLQFNKDNNNIIFKTELGEEKEINLYKILRAESPFISEFGF